MFMCYHPSAIDLPTQANGEAEVQLNVVAVGFCPGTVHQGGDKSHITAGSHLHLPDVEGYWITGPGEKLVPGLLIGIDPFNQAANRGFVGCFVTSFVHLAFPSRWATRPGPGRSRVI